MQQPKPSLIKDAARRLERGDLVAFPTETVYGLGADALNPDAVAKVFKAKGRPPTNPLIVHVADETMAQRVTTDWPDAARKVAHAFWPGPVSIILEKASCVPAIVTAGGNTVAVRCPDHPVALDLIRALGRPIVAPSANKSGSVSPTRAEHVASSFPELNLMILDGGPCRHGIESTVLSLIHSRPTILRLGTVSEQELAHVIGQTVATNIINDTNDSNDTSLNPQSAPADSFRDSHAPATGTTLSPGTTGSHYAPHCPIALFTSGDFESIRSTYQGSIVALVIHDRPDLASPSRVHIMPSDPADYARALYNALRQADDQHPALIAVELPSFDPSDPKSATWHAILDRLHRAAAPR